MLKGLSELFDDGGEQLQSGAEFWIRTLITSKTAMQRFGILGIGPVYYLEQRLEEVWHVG